MNYNQKWVIGLYLTIAICGCNQANKDANDNLPISDSISNVFISSSAAVENYKDTTRRFIRTADLKFKVKNVINSTYDIEKITDRQGGFVTYTNLISNINTVTNTAVSADSSLETTYYTVTNSITLRIPNTKLDTTLKEISCNIDYLDYRIIKAEDVALQIISNNLTQKRSAKTEERLTNAIENSKNKLNETTIAEEIVSSKQAQADNAKISTLSLTDQINFSTINLTIYQRQTIKREIISNDKNIDAYEPDLGAKLLDSLKYGLDILETLIVFFTKLWALFLIAILIYLIYKKYGLKLK